MREISCCEDRLKSMFLIDKAETPQKINKVIKAEIIYLLKNYFDITAEDVEVELGVAQTGEYILNITAKSRFLKVASCL